MASSSMSILTVLGVSKPPLDVEISVKTPKDENKSVRKIPKAPKKVYNRNNKGGRQYKTHKPRTLRF